MRAWYSIATAALVAGTQAENDPSGIMRFGSASGPSCGAPGSQFDPGSDDCVCSGSGYCYSPAGTFRCNWNEPTAAKPTTDPPTAFVADCTNCLCYAQLSDPFGAFGPPYGTPYYFPGRSATEIVLDKKVEHRGTILMIDVKLNALAFQSTRSDDPSWTPTPLTNLKGWVVTAYEPLGTGGATPCYTAKAHTTVTLHELTQNQKYLALDAPLPVLAGQVVGIRHPDGRPLMIDGSKLCTAGPKCVSFMHRDTATASSCFAQSPGSAGGFGYTAAFGFRMHSCGGSGKIGPLCDKVQWYLPTCPLLILLPSPPAG